jgi:16S rRNA (cytosine967-C5)-methyltransferase
LSAASQMRAMAATALKQVVADGRTTDQVMAGNEVAPLTRELVFGSLRHYFSLSDAINAKLQQSIRTKDQDIWFLMIVGAYQLRFLRIPDHAAVFETVSACRDLHKPWARGLVNAVLRGIGPVQEGDERSFEHPPWLESALRETYGADAEPLMRANNGRAPMTLRINLARTDPAAYRSRLAEAGLSFHPPQAAGGAGAAITNLGPETLVLDNPVPVEELPGYGEGLVSIQDAGAQFAAALLDPEPAARVLDACAAPGGKLFHMLERRPEADYTALEPNPARLEHIRAESRRLGHEAFVAAAGDAATLDWWDGTPFRRILLDAPCTGTGTLRRHPDIKVLRRPGDVSQAAALQQRLLANLWRVLEPGGTLLYCTCSILTPENDAIIAGLLSSHPDVQLEPLKLTSGRPTQYGWQLLPVDPETDGFYYARMSKAATE